MLSELTALPDKVRAHAAKLRDLVHKVEKTPLHEVHHVLKQLRTEIEALTTLANKASSRH
jgi:hypothetical protein